MSKKSNFSEIKARIDKESFWAFYRYHNLNKTAEHFKITRSNVERLAKEYGLVKSAEDIKKTSELTCLEKYGVSNGAQTSEAKLKAIQTRKDNNSYISAQEKAKVTRERLYGSVETSYRQGVKKAQKTLIEKFGSLENAYQSQQETRLKTFQERFGVDNPFQAEECKQKSRQTCLEKYGTEYANQSSNTKKLIFDSKLESGGPDNFGNWQQGQLTRIQNSGSLEESYRLGFEKQKETMLQKYGVECFFLSDELKNSRKKKDTTPNKIFAHLLDRYKIEYTQEFVLENKSYDFKIGNYLIEINPTITHNITFNPFNKDKPLDKKYHFNKTELAKKYGYRCIHIWDWDDLDKIIHQLILPRERIGARKTTINLVTKEESVDFCNRYHLQGYAKDEIRIGLYENNILVSLMTFGTPRYNKNFEFELIRYCTSKIVIGGAEKLFHYFIEHYNPTSIISYCDNNKFIGDVYFKLGFQYKNTTFSPHWYNIKTSSHILDSLLRQRGFDQLFGTSYGKGTSNEELILEAGYLKVIDAGQSSYIWNSN